MLHCLALPIVYLTPSLGFQKTCSTLCLMQSHEVFTTWKQRPSPPSRRVSLEYTCRDQRQFVARGLDYRSAKVEVRCGSRGGILVLSANRAKCFCSRPLVGRESKLLVKDARRPRMYGRVCHETSSLASCWTCTFIFTAIFFDLEMGFEQNPIWRSINMKAIWRR